MAKHYLRDDLGAGASLDDAERLLPADARADPEFLLAAGMVERDNVRALRLLAEAVARDPTMERAHFERATRLEGLWRSRGTLEREVAEMVDDEYAEVIAINPGNLGAWGNRGYVAWLLAGPELDRDTRISNGSDGPEGTPWKERAVESLQAGRQYKEVRRDAIVAELDWNLTRIAAENGEFTKAYTHYIEAVSAMLGEPRMGFLKYFYEPATEGVVRRFVEYKDRVLKRAKEAEATRAAEPRLIRSVKAFALNDCGLAHGARYERSGNVAHLRRARRCFDQAIAENQAFPLPHLNLAELDMLEARDAGPEQEMRLLESAADRLTAVLRGEPKWVLAQLALIQTQILLARTASSSMRRLATGPPTAWPQPLGSPDALTSPPSPSDDPRRRRAELDHERHRRRQEADDTLAALLPHAGFRHENGDGSRPDFGAKHARRTVARHRDDWMRDFNEIHVAALTHWAWALVEPAPAAAHELLTELRDTFYRADLGVVQLHRQAIELAMAAAPSGGGVDRSLKRSEEECEALIAALIEAQLEADPASHSYLREVAQISPERRRDLLSRLDNPRPSGATLIWIAGQRWDLADAEGALQAAREALEAPVMSAVASDWLRLGDLLVRLDATEAATTAYRRAIGSDEPAVAGRAAMMASRLLSAGGFGARSARLLARVTSDPETALAIAIALEAEGRAGEAVDAYRTMAVAENGASAAVSENARRLLVALLERRGGQDVAEIELHLRQLADGESQHRDWAALRLAQHLRQSDATEAESYLKAAIEVGAPGTTLAASELLIEMLNEQDRRDEVASVSVAAATKHSWVALCLGDRLRSERPELCEEVYKAGANPQGPGPDYAADASLRLGQVLSEKGEHDGAYAAYKEAIESADIRVAPDATIGCGEMVRGLASRKHSEDFYLTVAAWAATTATPTSFAVAFCRDLGERLTALSKPDIACAVHLTAAEHEPRAGLRLAATLEADGDPDTAQLIRARIAAA